MLAANRSLLTFPGTDQDPQVAFDFVADGNDSGSGAGVTSLSWTHCAKAGADVFVVFQSGAGTMTGATYGGEDMTLLKTSSPNGATASGYLRLYRISNVSAGPKTVSLTWSSGAVRATATSISYTGVGAVLELSSFADGSGVIATENVSSEKAYKGSGSLVLNVQGFLMGGTDNFVSAEGGVLRFQGMNSAKYHCVVVQEAETKEPVRFQSRVTPTATPWCSFTVRLLPTRPPAPEVMSISESDPGGTNNAALSWTHEIDSDARAIMIVYDLVFYYSLTSTTVTVGGVDATFLGGINYNYTGFNYNYLMFWLLLNPPTGPQKITCTTVANQWAHVGAGFAYKNCTDYGTLGARAFGAQSPNTVTGGSNTTVMSAWSKALGSSIFGGGPNQLWLYNVDAGSSVLVVDGYPGAAAPYFTYKSNGAVSTQQIWVPLTS